MSTKTLTEHLRDQLAAGWYEAIERKQFGWLWCRLPEVYKDKDDVAAQIRMYALEAVRMYDPDRGAFTTFLTHHLRLRTQAWQQYLWQRSSKARRGASFLLSSFADEYDSSTCGGIALVAYQSPLRWNGKYAVPTAVSTPAVAENHAKLNEALASLSTETLAFLDKLLAFPDQDRLAVMLRSSRYKNWLREHLEMTNEQIAALYNEVRAKAAFAL